MWLCSCLAGCLAWGVQHWRLLAVDLSCVLALRWRSLGELLPFDITWSQEVSGGPMSWIRLSQLRGTGLTPGQSTKTLSATGLHRAKDSSWEITAPDDSWPRALGKPLTRLWYKVRKLSLDSVTQEMLGTQRRETWTWRKWHKASCWRSAS